MSRARKPKLAVVPKPPKAKTDATTPEPTQQERITAMQTELNKIFEAFYAMKGEVSAKPHAQIRAQAALDVVVSVMIGQGLISAEDFNEAVFATMLAHMKPILQDIEQKHLTRNQPQLVVPHKGLALAKH